MSFANAQKFCFSVRQLDRIPNLDPLIHRTTSLVERFHFENFLNQNFENFCKRWKSISYIVNQNRSRSNYQKTNCTCSTLFCLSVTVVLHVDYNAVLRDDQNARERAPLSNENSARRRTLSSPTCLKRLLMYKQAILKPRLAGKKLDISQFSLTCLDGKLSKNL